MASVEVTISGMLYDRLNRTTQNVVLIGEASLTGVGVGGGPIIPPGSPPGIWGPTDPRPSNPIPIYPGGTPNPPGIWGPNDPRPTPPIANVPGLPPTIDPPTGEPDDDGFIKPPPDGGGWAYHQQYGWLYSPKGAGPK